MDHNNPREDMRERWTPSERQQRVAAAMLAADPIADRVYVPIALPGKTHGVWNVGQRVEHPGGFWLALRSGSAGVREAAEAAALAWLGDRVGTPSFASIGRDGTWAVFEGYGRREPVRLPDDSIRHRNGDPIA